MTNWKFQTLFSKTTWRDWLEAMRQYERAMNIDEFDLLERRIRSLESQVSELRAYVGNP